MAHLLKTLFLATLLGAALAGAVRPVEAPARTGGAVSAPGESPELAYLKQVNAWRPPEDPQLLFLLMAQFANGGRHREGVAYFEQALARFGPVLTDAQRGLYLAALAALRAGAAQDVFVLRRFGWVRETVRLLDEAKRLTGDRVFVTRWMSGVVRAQLPAFFGEQAQASEDLRWCEANAAHAPHAGWLREVYAMQARLGDTSAAGAHGPDSMPPAAGHAPVLFTTPFSEDPETGHAFAPRAVREVVPGTVYLLSGFEFTDYAFVISADRRELIAIDAGTRPDAARAALDALRARVPDLPPLTTVLVTHAHWDHVGGARALRELRPAPRFIGRDNYAEELAIGAMAHRATLARFFGRSFSLDDVLAYRPDVAIDRPTDLVVGGTRMQLLPTRGGETRDAMLVHLPDQGVLFVGDILMPYLGAPFSEEGSLDGLLAAIDQVHALAPRVLLHGHEPLTRVFASTALLDALRPQLGWLQDEVLREVRAGTERAVIHAANLVPPQLERADSGVHLAYLLLRENVINRLVDQQSGYWQSGLAGLDALTPADYGAALADYLGVTDTQLADAARRMIGDGRHELAAALLRWGEARFPGSAPVAAARRLAYLRLMEKYQEFNPFKFIVYAAQIDQAAPQMALPAQRPAEPGGAAR